MQNGVEVNDGYRQADNDYEGQLIGGDEDPENFFNNQDYEGNIFGMGDEFSNIPQANRIGNINSTVGQHGGYQQINF